MSWGMSVPPAEAARLRENAEAARDDYFAQAPGQDRPEIRDAIEAAIQAADHLLDGIGNPERVMVTFGGHANPEHKPHPGWANDSLTVTVVQFVPAQAEAAASPSA